MAQKTIQIVTAQTASPAAPTPKPEAGRKDPIGLAPNYWDDGSKTADTAPEGLSFHQVSVEHLEGELAGILETLDRAVNRATTQADLQSVELAEVEVSLGISANGSLSVLGLGAGVAGTTSVKLKLVPKKR